MEIVAASGLETTEEEYGLYAEPNSGINGLGPLIEENHASLMNGESTKDVPSTV